MPLPASILTPLSATQPYATGADLIARYDINDIRQWASDSGIPVSIANVAANNNVVTALMDASGDVEAALLASDRYLPQDLLALTGNSKNRLIRLVCELAIGYLYERRIRRGEEPEPAPATRGKEMLQRLAKGEWIFGFVEHGDAGVIAHQVEGAVDVERRNMVTLQAQRYYGRRSNRYDWTQPASVAPVQSGGTGLIGQ
jgi:phage gp36-like protein